MSKRKGKGPVAVAAVLMIIVGFALAYWCSSWKERAQSHGTEIVRKIEAYSVQHGELPSDLSAIGLKRSGGEGEAYRYKGRNYVYTPYLSGRFLLEFSLGNDKKMGYVSQYQTWTTQYYVDAKTGATLPW